MRCQTCGDETSPSLNECATCHTPLGQPAVTPGVATYRVRTLGLAAAVAVGVTAVLYLIVALVPVAGGAMAQRAARGGNADLLLGAVGIEVLLTLLFVAAYVTAAVLVIIWTWRARKNIDAFPGALPSLGAGWAIAGWLVPFANVVVPARVVANIARDSLWRRRTPALVVGWWAAWLVFSLGERLVSRVDEREYGRLVEAPTTDPEFQAYVAYYQGALGRHVVPMLACVLAAVSFIVLVRRISTAQQERIDRAAPAWPIAPGWPGASGQAWPAGQPAFPRSR